MTVVPGDGLCRGPQQLSPLRKPKASTASMNPMQISLLVTPQVFMIADASHLSASHLLSTSPSSKESQGSAPAASPGLCGRVGADFRPRPCSWPLVLQSRGRGWFLHDKLLQKDSPFLSLEVPPPPCPPARFAMPAARGKTSLNARDW